MVATIDPRLRRSFFFSIPASPTPRREVSHGPAAARLLSWSIKLTSRPHIVASRRWCGTESTAIQHVSPLISGRAAGATLPWKHVFSAKLKALRGVDSPTLAPCCMTASVVMPALSKQTTRPFCGTGGECRAAVTAHALIALTINTWLRE